jgi:hypothetical protein
MHQARRKYNIQLWADISGSKRRRARASMCNIHYAMEESVGTRVLTVQILESDAWHARVDA